MAEIVDEMQGRKRPLRWRIILDDESPLSVEIIETIIPRDFRFPDLKYSERSDPLMHIERFNNIMGMQGLTPA